MILGGGPRAPTLSIKVSPAVSPGRTMKGNKKVEPPPSKDIQKTRRTSLPVQDVSTIKTYAASHGLLVSSSSDHRVLRGTCSELVYLSQTSNGRSEQRAVTRGRKATVLLTTFVEQASLLQGPARRVTLTHPFPWRTRRQAGENTKSDAKALRCTRCTWNTSCLLLKMSRVGRVLLSTDGRTPHVAMVQT